MDRKDEKCGVIDLDGKIIVPFEHDSTIHYYRWGDAPVIWDDKQASAFVYRNGEWICISMHTFYDHADEIVDDREFQQFFSEHILKEYERYLADRYKFDAKNARKISDL
jgi:hypothetical protein